MGGRTPGSTSAPCAPTAGGCGRSSARRGSAPWSRRTATATGRRRAPRAALEGGATRSPWRPQPRRRSWPRRGSQGGGAPPARPWPASSGPPARPARHRPAHARRAHRPRGRRRARRRLRGRGLDARLPRGARGPRPRRSAAPPASTSSTTAAWAGSGPSTARRCCGSPAPSPPTPTWSWPASGPTSPPPTNPTTTRATSSTSSPASSRSPRRSAPSSPASPSTPPTAPPSSARQRSHFDMARCGVALYGLDPFQVDPTAHGLAPVLSLRSHVAAVKRFPAGQSAGYGRRWRAPADTWVGVVPLGYGDGVRRALTNNCDVLVGGRRYPLVGTVSMDNLTIDLGSETDGHARGRGGADRPPGRGGDPRRGARRAARHDQLRDHHRAPAARPAEGRVSVADDLRGAELPRAAIERARRGGRDLDRRRRRPRRGARPAGHRPRPRRRRRSRRGRKGARPRARRARLRALRRVRHLARRRPLARLAGRRHRPARRLDRGRPRRPRLHRRRRRRAAGRGGRRSTPAAGSPTSSAASSVPSARGASPRTRCACCAPHASPRSST